MEFDELVAEMQDAELALINAQTIYDRRKQEVIDWMGEHREKSRVAPYGGRQIQVTRVVRETVSFDSEALIRALGKRGYNRLTTQKVDRKLVELAVADGRINPAIMAKAMKVTESAPFLKITEIREVPEDAE